MKLVGITGTGTGKLGSSVFAVNSGVQIVRQYQPVVSNPSTEAQVAQRAKLKLASQLARDLSPAIAIPKDGLVSSRNGFIAANFKSLSFDNGTASVDLDTLDLTKSTRYFGTPFVTFSSDGTTLSVSLNSSAKETYDYADVFAYRRNSNGTLSFIAKASVTKGTGDVLPDVTITNETSGTFDSKTICFVYGYNFTESSAKARYNEMSVDSAVTVASLVASRIVAASDVAFSESVSAVAVHA